jgi:hypothetical protein
MNEEDINWHFVRNEIISKGCGIGAAYGSLVFDYENYTYKKRTLKNSAPILITRKFKEYRNKKKLFELTTIIENINYQPENEASNADPFIHRYNRVKETEYEFRNRQAPRSSIQESGKRKFKKKDFSRKFFLQKPQIDFYSNDEDYDRLSEMLFLGGRCQAFLCNVLSGNLKHEIDKRQYLIQLTLEAHQELINFTDIIVEKKCMDMALTHTCTSNNEIFLGFISILKNISQICHRRFNLEQHIAFCGASECPVKYFISSHKLRDKYCSNECRKKEENAHNLSIYKKNFIT